MLPAGARKTAADVAVTTFRVLDAPANYVRRKIDEEEAATDHDDYARQNAAFPML